MRYMDHGNISNGDTDIQDYRLNTEVTNTQHHALRSSVPFCPVSSIWTRPYLVTDSLSLPRTHFFVSLFFKVTKLVLVG